MNKIKFWTFTLVVSLLVSCSQQKRYISYKVKEGETIRDIAERIDVKTEDLVRLNPDIGENPSANSVIIIPNPEYKKSIPLIQKPKDDRTTEGDKEENNPETSNGEVTTDNDNTQKPDSTQIVRTVYVYKEHTVKPGETVYRITKEYNISKDELMKLNPQFPRIKDNYLDVGQALKVKVAEEKTFYISREEDLKNHVTHTVQSKETVYGITRFYNITKEELVNLNPEFPEIVDNKLQIGQVLRIRSLENNISDNVSKMFIDSIATDKEEHIKLAFLLPFRAKEYDTISYKKIFDLSKGRRGNANLANLVTDFYMGSEIAIDSIKSLGIKVDISVFDTGNRGKNIPKIIEDDQLEEMNAIIGPFYSNKVKEVADKTDAPVIFPHFSKNQSTFSSSKIVKSAPDKITRSRILGNYLSKIHNRENIFIVSDGSEVSNEQAKEITLLLKNNESVKNVFVIKPEPEKDYIKKERFTDKMKPNLHNWVILATDKKVLVANAINSMIVLPENTTAQVFSIEKSDETYENVDNNTLARIGFTYVTDHFINSDDENMAKFVKKYKARNNDIPSTYAVRGFDITFDVLMRLASGEKLLDTYKQGTSIRLENKFEFDKKFFGSVYNKGLFIVKYNPDLTLERIQ